MASSTPIELPPHQPSVIERIVGLQALNEQWEKMKTGRTRNRRDMIDTAQELIDALIVEVERVGIPVRPER